VFQKPKVRLPRPERGISHPVLAKLLPSAREARDRVLADRKVSLGVPFDDKTQALLVEAMSIPRALLDTNSVYPFRLTNVATWSTTAGGVLAGFVSFDPSNIPLPEYATLSALFDQVRLSWARLTITNVNPHSDGYAVGNQKYGTFVACDPGLTATTPGSIAAVIDCPNVLVFNLASPKTFHIEYKARGRQENAFARTSTPAPGPYAGCYGQFQWYNGGLTVSTAYIQTMFEGFYEFTSRT